MRDKNRDKGRKRERKRQRKREPVPTRTRKDIGRGKQRNKSKK